jgi:hypothetical protein
MSTTLNYTLKATGGDYSLIKSWIADMQSQHPNLVSEDINLQLDIYNDWPGGLNESFVDFSNTFTTDATHQLILNVVESERHDGTPGSGFHFATTSSNYTLYSRYQFVTFDGLEVSAPLASEPMFGASNNATIKNCILHDITSFGFSDSSGATFDNCIVYNVAPASSGNAGTAFKNATLKNITAYIKYDGGGYGGNIIFNSCDCTNVYLYHNRAATTYNGFHSCTGDYNASLAISGTLPGSNSVTTTNDSDLENISIDDYRIKSTSPLKTSGESGGAIGSLYEDSAPAALASDINVILSSPQFSAEASATLPQPSSAVSLSLLSPTFNASASATLPQPESSIGVTIGKPAFSVGLIATLPQPELTVSLTIDAPKFSVQASATLPSPVSAISFSMAEPKFSIQSEATLPSGSSTVNVTMPAPAFSISSSVTLPQPSATVLAVMPAPVFNVSLSITELVAASSVNLTIESPIFNASLSATLPRPANNVQFDIDKPIFSIRTTVSGLNITAAPNAKIILTAESNKIALTYKSNKVTLNSKSNYIEV